MKTMELLKAIGRIDKNLLLEVEKTSDNKLPKKNNAFNLIKEIASLKNSIPITVCFAVY